MFSPQITMEYKVGLNGNTEVNYKYLKVVLKFST